MGKFNKKGARAAKGNSPLRAAEATPATPNYHGAPGFTRELKTELFMLGVSNMAGESTFYESGQKRDERYTALIRQAVVEDPAWSSGFLAWLRSEGNMRSASLTGALEAAKAMLDAKIPGARKVVSSVLQRPDEPGEALAYWTSKYGRSIPKPVKRGIADAVQRLYTERAVLKYDTDSHGFRFADVLNLVHPEPKDYQQGYLFGHAMERRFGRDTDWDDPPNANALPMLHLNTIMRDQVAEGADLGKFHPQTLKAAGITWENALSMAGPNVDKKALWEALIPSMGYMALLRNLRNFDQAGVDDSIVDQIIVKLTDPGEVARSRQFPFRFYAAYLATKGSLRWARALEKALQLSLSNVPALDGHTLVLVDQSPSMFPDGGWYAYKPVRSDMSNADVAKLFGSALALRAETATLIGYGGHGVPIPFMRGDAVLTTMEKFRSIDYTDTFGVVKTHLKPGVHKRIVIVTDEQDQYNGFTVNNVVPADVPVYLWNIGGNKVGSIGSGPNRNSFAGLTDAAFSMIPLIETGKNAAWPWLAWSSS